MEAPGVLMHGVSSLPSVEPPLLVITVSTPLELNEALGSVVLGLRRAQMTKTRLDDTL